MEQLVVVLDRVADVAAAGEVEAAGGHDVGESRVLPGVSVEQADVVGRRAHAGSVQARRRRGTGVTAAELGGQVVDLLHGGVHAAELRGQRVRGVVAGVHEQAVQQVIDRIEAVLTDPDLGALGIGVVLSAWHDLVDRQFFDRLHCDQHLDDAGRPVAAVRVPRGDDVAGVEVGDQPRFGGDVPGHGRRAGGGDDAAAGQRVTAEWLGRHRQRSRRIACLRHLGGVDRRRRRRPVWAGRGFRCRVRLGSCHGHADERRRSKHRQRRDQGNGPRGEHP